MYGLERKRSRKLHIRPDMAEHLRRIMFHEDIPANERFELAPTIELVPGMVPKESSTIRVERTVVVRFSWRHVSFPMQFFTTKAVLL